jgi:fatty acid desaturase
MRKFLDTDHPMFRPLWVRVLIVAVACGWGLLEFATGAPFWGVIFLALGGYAAWGFFFAFDPDRKDR